MSTIFDEYATTYRDAVNSAVRLSGDTVDEFARVKAALLKFELHGASGLRLLDFGCGTGIGTRALTKALPGAKAIVGTDPSSQSILAARERHGDVAGKAEFLHQAGDALPFDDGAFDVVFASGVFHHIDRTDHARWLSELRRVLVDRGALFLFEHNPWNPLTRWVVRDCPFDEGTMLLSPRYARRMLRAARFTPEPSRFYYFFPALLSPLRRLEPYLRWCPLGAQYYLRASRA